MHFAKDTLDDILKELYPVLLASNQHVRTSRGNTCELLGVLLEIAKPRARLSRTETRGKPFSCLGELLWYLTGDNELEFIRRYIPRYVDESEDGLTVYGGYGKRLYHQRGQNQIGNVISLLSKRPNSRRAVIQLFDAEDIGGEYKEVPCTTTLQFFVRDGRLFAAITMRSNDAFMGLPHDVFCFTMLQEMIACALNLELGTYRHFVGSMHFYDRDFEKANLYLKEGYQSRIEMPQMPKGEPWGAVKEILRVEPSIRVGKDLDADMLGLDPYWADFVRLLQVFMTNDDAKIDELRHAMSFQKYGMYIVPRMHSSQ